MATVTTKTIGDITYTIHDHSADGLTTEQVIDILENLSTTDTYDKHIEKGLDGENSAGQSINKEVDIHIDGLNPNGGMRQTSANTKIRDPETNDVVDADVNLSSQDFTDTIENTYAEEGTGERIQKDVDSALIHELKHVVDKREGILDMSDTALVEDSARDVANELREKQGRGKREAYNRAEVDINGDGTVTQAELESIADSNDDGILTEQELKDAADKNDDGVVSDEEKAMFGDTNWDGTITDEELNEANKATEKASEEAAVRDAAEGWTEVQDVDTDNGSNPNITPNHVYDTPYSPSNDTPNHYYYNGEALGNNPWAAGLAAGIKSPALPWLGVAVGGLGGLAIGAPALAPWIGIGALAAGVGVLAYYSFSQLIGSPLVLDLDGDGVELVSLENTTVSWNIDEDDFNEASGWVAADDGLLAIDLNGDGVINDHSELFGTLDTDGFTILSIYDTNSDDVIDANDAQFDDLLVWQDVNQNGISEGAELYSLADLDIASIDLNASTPNNLEIEGHHISHVSSYTVDDGVNPAQAFDIIDAWFNYDDINTNYVGDYTLDPEALAVVNVRGYGNLPDMYISASIDNDTSDPNSLLSLLQDFTELGFDGVFVDDHSIEPLVTDIMYRWAGVDGVDPSSRGGSVDSRSLEFLEKLMNDTWFNTAGNGVGGTPALQAAEELDVSFELAHNAVTGIFSAQVAASSLFNDGAYYDFTIDAFVNFSGFKQDGLDDLLAKSLDATKVTDKMEFWMGVVNAVDTVIGIDNLDATALSTLNATLAASDPSLNAQDLVDRIALELEFHRHIVSVPNDGDNLDGSGSDDTYAGSVGNDGYNGYNGLQGNDTINGHIGDDNLSGNGGNDSLTGGLGDDYLNGGNNDDTYYYYAGHGNDTIEDLSGTDQIVFGEGIALSDITFERVNNDQLRLDIDVSVGGGSILIKNMFGGDPIESLLFDDGTTYIFANADPVYNGTDEAETIYGTPDDASGTGVDYIYGNGGDDTIFGAKESGSSTNENYLWGGDGNDTLNGDAGIDTLHGDDGEDILKGANGNDLLYGGAGVDDLRGQSGDDQLWGDAGDDTLTGGSGDDMLYGGDGADSLNGEDNVDTLYGEAGDDNLLGGGSGDTLYGGDGDDTIDGEGGNDEAHGGEGTDTISGSNGEDTLYSDGGDDILYGGDKTDTLYGGTGSDQLFGGDYGDTLYGGDGNDTLHGEAGKDILSGGDGVDILTGGAKADTFIFENTTNVFSEIDTITDFSVSQGDELDLSDLLAAYDPLTDAISDFIQITDNGTDSVLSVDADGGADNFIQIATLLNATGLTDEAALESSGTLITA